MFQPVTNNVIVLPPTKYIKHISKILKISSIENNSTVDPVEIVNIIGKIVAIPKKITDDQLHKGFTLDNIMVGDMGIFRYDVIYDMIQRKPDTEPEFRNLIPYKGKHYFACDITKLFAVIRDGEIIMLNGYTMITEFADSKIFLPASMKRVKGCTKAQVMHSNSKGINPSDFVYFSPLKAQRYETNDKKFCILEDRFILGTSDK